MADNGRINMYYTYVLKCQDKTGNYKYYIGYSIDLRKRINEHLAKQVKTTKQFKNVDLVYYEACLNKTDALKRELQLKTGFGRSYIKRRLENYLKRGCGSRQ